MSALTLADVAGYRAVIGRTMTMTQVIDAANLARFAAATGADQPGANGPGAGGPVPLEHWAFFHEVVPDARLGPDGHPRRGDFLPAIAALPRRMFAAATIHFHASLMSGVAATLEVRIADLRHTQGASGDLVFVEVDRVVTQGDTMCLTERQTLVYRPAASPAQPPPAQGSPAPATRVPPRIMEKQGDVWVPNTVHLFRFSAATGNSHRIHYDWPYATQIEGYPDLVVHGPFIAAKLAALAARRGTLASFTFRASAPCFVGRLIRLVEVEPGTVHAIRDDGTPSMMAKATYR